jgi:hypothetical protein
MVAGGTGPDMVEDIIAVTVAVTTELTLVVVPAAP